MTVPGRSLPARAAIAIGGSGALAAGMLLTATGPAQAVTESCGSVITTSVVLTANVNCQSVTTKNALTIEAPGVTVNLNGHKLLGPGDSAGTEGIVDDGNSDVTVENGTISNFSTDVDIEGSSGSDLTGIVVQRLTTTDTTEDQSTAVYGDYLDGAYIHNLSASDPSTGVELDNSQDSTVTGNKMTRPFVGLYDDEGTGNTWSHNTLSGVSDDGVETELATGAVIEYNAVTGGDAYGVDNEGATDIVVMHNSSSGAYGGVFDGSGSGDTISDNTGSGDLYGIYTAEASDDTLSGNTFGGGVIGIETDYPDGETLIRNITNGNSENGVYVYTDNDTTGGYTATLTRNTANKNAFGLYAQIPTSGHGNHASGNKVVNCHNVHCVNAGTRHGAAVPVHLAPAPHLTPARR